MNKAIPGASYSAFAILDNIASPAHRDLQNQPIDNHVLASSSFGNSWLFYIETKLSYRKRKSIFGEFGCIVCLRMCFCCFWISLGIVVLIGRSQCCRGGRDDAEPERVVWHVLLKGRFGFGNPSLRDTGSGPAGKTDLTRFL